MKNNSRMKSIDRLRNLLKTALSRREEIQSSIYKVSFINDEKENMIVYHHNKYFFEYDMTDKEIIRFGRINQCTKSNLDIICKILKLTGEFRNDYKRVGYDLVYYREGTFYDKKMNMIHYNLDDVLKKHDSKINKQRYNKIRTIMSSGKVELDEIPGHKTWLKKINGKWYTFSDLEKDLYFPVLAKEVFDIISAGISSVSVLSKKIYIVTQIYKKKYNEYITKKIDSGEIGEWGMDIKNKYSNYAFKLVKLEKENKEVIKENKEVIKENKEVIKENKEVIKENKEVIKENKEVIKENKEKDEQWILESEGEITFDKRTMNRSHVKDFIRYILSIEIPDPLQDKYLNHLNRWDWCGPPDIIKNTPINLLIEENKKFDHKMLDLLKIVGNEIRINYRNNRGADNTIIKEFIATSIYGKECVVFEHDIDMLLRNGYFYKIFQRFDENLALERSLERIALLKDILPGFKSRYPIILNENNKTLIIINKDGEFHISMVDAVLTKIVGNDDIYICVGPLDNINISPCIILNGIRYEIDFITDEILSKMIMLIEEKYPDITTEKQIKYKKIK